MLGDLVTEMLTRDECCLGDGNDQNNQEVVFFPLWISLKWTYVGGGAELGCSSVSSGVFLFPIIIIIILLLV